MFRDTVLIRPPCEASSVIIGMTEGCTWNRCRFCGVYSNGIQNYRIRPLESIMADIDDARHLLGRGARRVFLAGGNALSAPTDLWINVLEHLLSTFPRLEQVSCYAKNHDILKKSSDDLETIAHAGPGLKIVYMGLESGSNAVLKYMRKGTTATGMLRAARKIMAAGIQLSAYVILGLGDHLFQDHAIETARLLTEMNPDYIRFRSLNFIPNADLYRDWQAGAFTPLRPVEILEEQVRILKELGPNVMSHVLNDHISNPVYFDGKLPHDREHIVAALERAISSPEMQSLQHANRVTM
jgi:radical SAM superfamily enzyme YgiQ (UPF0313 family)